METVLKVCDAMESVSINAATFVCGKDTADDASRCFDSTMIKGFQQCGDIAARCESHRMDGDFLHPDDDNNSVCETTVCGESGNNKYHHHNTIQPSLQSRRGMQPLQIIISDDENERLKIFSDDENDLNTFGRESSWPSVDGKQPGQLYSKPEETYSKSLLEYDNQMCGATFDNEENDSGKNDKTKSAVEWDKIGLGLFTLPQEWTDAITKNSSWGSGKKSHKTEMTRSLSSHSSNSGRLSLDSMHDSLGEHHYMSIMKKNAINSIGSKEWEAGFKSPNNRSPNRMMAREMPSFGKSREFRSFNSNRSNEGLEVGITLKPTYMTPDESNKLHDRSNQYNYIIHTVSSDTVSTNPLTPDRSMSTAPMEDFVEPTAATRMSKSSPTTSSPLAMSDELALKDSAKGKSINRGFLKKRTLVPKFY